MTKEQMANGLLSLDVQHPFYQAVLALLGSDIEQETEAAVAPDLTDGARHYNTGRLAYGRDFRRVLEGTIEEAVKERALALVKAERLAAIKKAQQEGTEGTEKKIRMTNDEIRNGGILNHERHENEPHN